MDGIIKFSDMTDKERCPNIPMKNGKLSMGECEHTHSINGVCSIKDCPLLSSLVIGGVE